jgi:hypothetical protein
MRTRLLLLCLALPLVGGARLRAEENAAKSHITSVGLFKNGLAVVKREVTLPGPGTYRFDDVPTPVYGTYWVEASADVESAVKMRDVEGPIDFSAGSNLQEELAGHKVDVHLREGKGEPVSGTVVKLERARGDEAWSRRFQPRPYVFDGQPSPSRFLILQTAKGRAYVDASQISYVDAEGVGDKIRQRKPVLVLTVGGGVVKEVAVSVTYLARGLSWAPSYRVDISDPKTLTLEQSAVVRNELTDLDDAAVFLISGFPSTQFAHVTSPLSASTSWALFFQELKQRVEPGYDSTSNVISQQLAVAPGSPLGLDLSATPSGEGVDLHYQAIGKRKLAEGESLALTTARGKATYERIVEWLVPDTRDADGAFVGRRRGEDPDGYEGAAWDALRFKNPLEFPMTTAPAMVVAKGRFNGQRLSTWVNAGEETILHVTKALSVRTRSIEQEEQRKNGDDERQVVYIGGRRFRRTTVQGELAVSNHRKEAITLVVRRRFSGELLGSEGSPKLNLREEGVYSVNKRNELIWNFPLKSGEERKLSYRYSVLVNF